MIFAAVCGWMLTVVSCSLMADGLPSSIYWQRASELRHLDPWTVIVIQRKWFTFHLQSLRWKAASPVALQQYLTIGFRCSEPLLWNPLMTVTLHYSLTSVLGFCTPRKGRDWNLSYDRDICLYLKGLPTPPSSLDILDTFLLESASVLHSSLGNPAQPGEWEKLWKYGVVKEILKAILVNSTS